jgi:hypothetical protein
MTAFVTLELAKLRLELDLFTPFLHRHIFVVVDEPTVLIYSTDKQLQGRYSRGVILDNIRS